MSINPNTHRPINIDQEITRLNTTFQEYNTIDRKKEINKRNGYLNICVFIATSVFAIMLLAQSETTLKEKTIRNLSAEAPDGAILFCVFIFIAASALLVGGLNEVDDKNLNKDPLVAKYLKRNKLKNHAYLDFSKDIRKNRIKYNELNNFKMVINSEAGKTLPDDVWNIITGYII